MGSIQIFESAISSRQLFVLPIHFLNFILILTAEGFLWLLLFQLSLYIPLFPRFVEVTELAHEL